MEMAGLYQIQNEVEVKSVEGYALNKDKGPSFTTTRNQCVSKLFKNNLI